MKGVFTDGTAGKMLTFKTFSLSVLIVVACCGTAHAGPSVDSRRDSLRYLVEHTSIKDTVYLENLIQLAILTRNESVEGSKIYFQDALDLAENLSAVRFQIRALNGLGICNSMLDRYGDAIRNFEMARDIALRHRQLHYAADSYNSLGIVYKRLGDYPVSLSFYNKAISLYDSLDDDSGMASCYDNMGILFDLMKEPEEAMTSYQQAMAIYQRLDKADHIATLNSNIALLLLQQGDYQRAIEIIKENLTYYRQHNLALQELQEMVNLGYAYYQTKAFDEGQPYLMEAYQKAEELGIHQISVDALYSLAKIKADQGASAAAIDWAHKAATIADATASLSLRSKAQELLSYVFERAGNVSRAFVHQKKYKSLDDSLFNEYKTTIYKRQQVLMEVNEKDRQLEAKNIQLDLLNDRFYLEKKWNWTLGIAILLLLLAGILYYQKYHARIRHAHELELRNALVTEQKEEIEKMNLQLEKQILLRKETDDTINYFATSLFGKNTIEEVLWDVAKNCISRLGLVDCVIYLVDESRGVLIQKAAYGSKNPADFNIHEPIEIPLGSGIVGTVAKTGVAEIINDTTADSRYIVDDQIRHSEMAVPLIIQQQVIGVIDTEHPEKNFYTQYHLEALVTIASICASKISQAQADEKALKAKEAQREAEQIKQLDRLKSQFFANISHEFRTPLNLILAPLQKKEQITSEEMDMMGRNARRLLRLVNQLLDLAKIEVGLVKPEVRYINVFRFIGDMANSFMPLADSKDITYLIEIPERDYIGYFDPDKLEKIVYNLLSNAFKFTPSGGKIGITLKTQNNTLRIAVVDNGIGIPENLRNKIFTRFYQVDGSLTRPYEGSGIGLALTKELVDLLQGTIEVESEVGDGCSFSVSIPESGSTNQQVVGDAFPETKRYYLEDSPEKDPVLESPFNNTENLPTVLIVEDNLELRSYVSAELGKKFYFLEAQQGREGLALAQKKIPDLIITDIMMPVMDGITMVKYLRDDERTSHIPIILLTSRDDGETKIKGFETGAEQYVVKPFEMDELVARMHSLLSQGERLRKKFSRALVLKPRDITINNRDAVFLEKTIKIIEDNVNRENFTVEQLQSEIGMSRMQLHRKLKALTNQSASDFIRSVKLKRAAQILRQPGIQIAEAAYLSGFNHMSYFSKCFKDEFGMLPSEYVKTAAAAAEIS